MYPTARFRSSEPSRVAPPPPPRARVMDLPYRLTGRTYCTVWFWRTNRRSDWSFSRGVLRPKGRPTGDSVRLDSPRDWSNELSTASQIALVRRHSSRASTLSTSVNFEFEDFLEVLAVRDLLSSRLLPLPLSTSSSSSPHARTRTRTYVRTAAPWPQGPPIFVAKLS
ncbi:hypothetical protein L227DRAFT_245975 [Lentinus tigrinus ALCF2SS1-6]|uniref:Uncharacterized protein n=1 Tax=Lentinus tigrinus ALCF2SS1-6 TaxID=1328759 RepID=A0A5C2S0H6_9APHY|nr:hypothetical protein L227DRAFT_245975 [Lentinus tigrinus ALCF2SS1-6]